MWDVRQGKEGKFAINVWYTNSRVMMLFYAKIRHYIQCVYVRGACNNEVVSKGISLNLLLLMDDFYYKKGLFSSRIQSQKIQSKLKLRLPNIE